MDPFVIGFIGFVLSMVSVVTVIVFDRRDESRHVMTARDWEVQMVASSMI